MFVFSIWSRERQKCEKHKFERKSGGGGWGWSTSGLVICDILRSWVTQTASWRFFLCGSLLPSFRINLPLLRSHSQMRAAHPEHSDPAARTTSTKTKRLRSSASLRSTHPHCSTRHQLSEQGNFQWPYYYVATTSMSMLNEWVGQLLYVWTLVWWTIMLKWQLHFNLELKQEI